MDKFKIGQFIAKCRKGQNLTQEQLAEKLGISKNAVSKWERGQSYPDFQRLVMLSDYFNMTLDELVKGIDVQDVREKNMTDEKVASIYMDVESGKATLKKILTIISYVVIALIALFVVTFLVHLAFPDIEWLWNRM